MNYERSNNSSAQGEEIRNEDIAADIDNDDFFDLDIEPDNENINEDRDELDIKIESGSLTSEDVENQLENKKETGIKYLKAIERYIKSLSVAPRDKKDSERFKKFVSEKQKNRDEFEKIKEEYEKNSELVARMRRGYNASLKDGEERLPENSAEEIFLESVLDDMNNGAQEIHQAGQQIHGIFKSFYTSFSLKNYDKELSAARSVLDKYEKILSNARTHLEGSHKGKEIKFGDKIKEAYQKMDIFKGEKASAKNDRLLRFLQNNELKIKNLRELNEILGSIGVAEIDEKNILTEASDGGGKINLKEYNDIVNQEIGKAMKAMASKIGEYDLEEEEYRRLWSEAESEVASRIQKGGEDAREQARSRDVLIEEEYDKILANTKAKKRNELNTFVRKIFEDPSDKERLDNMDVLEKILLQAGGQGREEYVVEILKQIDKDFDNEYARGIDLSGLTTQGAKVNKILKLLREAHKVNSDISVGSEISQSYEELSKNNNSRIVSFLVEDMINLGYADKDKSPMEIRRGSYGGKLSNIKKILSGLTIKSINKDRISKTIDQLTSAQTVIGRKNPAFKLTAETIIQELNKI